MPKMRRAVSVRPDPSSPERPRISPLADAEVEWFDRAFAANLAQFEKCAAIGLRGRGLRNGLEVEFAQFSAHHFGNELKPGQGGGLELADEFAVAQHGDAIGDGVDLVEKMRDEQDAESFGLELAHDAEETFDFALVKTRSRLVENQRLARRCRAREQSRRVAGWQWSSSRRFR